MSDGLFITGTDTGVGKTIVTAALGSAMRRLGADVGVTKPLASGCTLRDGQLVSEDAEFLRAAIGVDDPLGDINPVALELPLAPLVAAREAEVDIDMEGVIQAVWRLGDRYDWLLVEGVGGLMVPLAEMWLAPDMMRTLGFPLLVVARSTLGTINHTLLTVNYAKTRGLGVTGIIINRLEDDQDDIAARSNPEIIAEFANAPVLGVVPHVRGLDVGSPTGADLEPAIAALTPLARQLLQHTL